MSDLNIPNAMSPFENLLCGGQLTHRDLEDAKAKGYRTIINLRPASEQGAFDEAAAAKELGLDYLNIPVAGEADLTMQTVQALHDALERHPMPAIVHCASGNRVGALFAMRAAWIEGKSVEEAIRIGRQSGLTGLEAAIIRLLNEAERQ